MGSWRNGVGWLNLRGLLLIGRVIRFTWPPEIGTMMVHIAVGELEAGIAADCLSGSVLNLHVKDDDHV